MNINQTFKYQYNKLLLEENGKMIRIIDNALLLPNDMLTKRQKLQIWQT